MSKVVFRLSLLVLPLGLAAWAGCSSDNGGGDTPTPDAGPDTYVPPPVTDAGDAGPAVDCESDKGSDGLFAHLSCETLFASMTTKTIAPANEPYKPSREFWSDGAAKKRWAALPTGTKIDTTDPDEWVFPVGTKLWKEFSLEGKRIETRLYWKSADATWLHASYRWTADESEAVKNDNNQLVPVTGKRDYEIPNKGQCDECHIGKKEPVLGFEAVGLGLPGAEGLTLDALQTAGRLDPPLPKTTLAIPDDGTGKAVDALGWMHANCGSCHTQYIGGEAHFSLMFLRLQYAEVSGTATTPDAFDAVKTSVCVDPQTGRLNDAGAAFKRVAPGDVATSLVSFLSAARVPVGQAPGPNNQMPPVVTHVIDDVGHAQLDAWITARTACPAQ